MKLTKTKLLETIRVLNDGKSKYQARKIAGISKQRVYQVWKIYTETGLLPEIGKVTGRPVKVVESGHSTGVFTSGSHASSIRESKCTAPTTSERPDRREHATSLLTGGGREHFDDWEVQLVKQSRLGR